jgi:hypothetical protein
MFLLSVFLEIWEVIFLSLMEAMGFEPIVAA